MKYCARCGAQIDDSAAFCPACGAPQNAQDQTYGSNPYTQQQYSQYSRPQYTGPTPYPGYEQKSKLAAGLLGIFLGGFGVGRFYLGYNGLGIAQIVVTICTCGIGSIWGLVDGILILTGTPPVDANGVPLRD